ncbi:MAG: NADH-quinone oxidoreductase subunit C [Nitrososphaerales archaeon]
MSSQGGESEQSPSKDVEREAKAQEPTVEIPPLEKNIIDKIDAKFGDKVKLAYTKPRRIRFDIKPDVVVEFARFLRDEIGFDHPISVAGTDYPKDNVIEVIYHIGCCTVPEYRSSVFAFALKLPRDNPKTPTLIPVYRGVEYHERETFEMLGVIFEGHPKLQRLLLPEDWADIPPLRKDFSIKGR